MAGFIASKTQHYIPRFVLKHFTEKKEQIWVFDKQTGRKFKTNIKNVAAESGFYDFEFKGHKVTFEPSLAKFEGQVSKVIKEIVQRESLSFIGDNERMLLSRFLALQFVRTKQWRNMWNNMTEAFAQSIRKKGWKPEEIEGYKELTSEDTKLYHMRSVYKADEFIPYFFGKIWVILKATRKHPFWISDNPISLQNMNDFGFYGNIGLAVKGIEIYFPLTKKLSLGLWCPSHKEEFEKLYNKYTRLLRVSPKMVDQVVGDPLYIEQLKAGIEEGRPILSKYENIINHNSLQVKYAARFVYSCNEDFSLAEEMIKAHPNLREGPKIEVN